MSSQPAWIVIAEDNAPDVFLIREALKRRALLPPRHILGWR